MLRRKRWFYVLLSVLCLVLLGAHTVCGWSGANAYTLVLLTEADTILRSAFYDAPAGTVLDVFPEDGAGEVGRSGAERMMYYATLTPPMRPPASWPDMPPRLPYRVALSDEWVVLEQPGCASRGDVVEGTLLHCRLPLRQSAAARRAARTRFVALYEPPYRDAIAAWWLRRVTQGRGSGCLHGQGEGGGTGYAPRFYSLCPAEGLWRVRHLTLLAVLHERRRRATPPSAESNDDKEDGNGTRRGADSAEHALSQPPLSEYCPRCLNHTHELPRRVLKFLGEMHKSRAVRSSVLSDNALAAAFERVGEYDETRSLPRWNAELRVWEMLYPSTQPCSAHLGGPTQGHPPGMTQSTTNRGRTWRTLVRLHCAPADVSRDTDLHEWEAVHHWTITEVRQTCRYEVELSTHVVCDWERALDALQVNPVPCVPLS